MTPQSQRLHRLPPITTSPRCSAAHFAEVTALESSLTARTVVQLDTQKAEHVSHRMSLLSDGETRLARSQGREPARNAMSPIFPLHISNAVCMLMSGDGVRRVTALGADNSYTDLLARRSCHAVTDQAPSVFGQMSRTACRVFWLLQYGEARPCVMCCFRWGRLPRFSR